ncbi:MAG: outer membrane protein assembly factor BamB family protein [Armatimonadota bacterium]
MCRRIVGVKRIAAAFAVAAVLGCLIAYGQSSLDWPMFRHDEERTGFHSGVNGHLTASSGNVDAPRSRWNYPHTVPNPSQKDRPFLDSIGKTVASPAVGTVGGQLVAVFASFKSYTVQTVQGDTTSAVSAEYGTVYCLDGYDGISAPRGGPLWWYGYRDVPYDATNVTSTAEHEFLVAVSRRIAQSYPDYDENAVRTQQPLAPVRSSPALYELPQELQYESKWKRLDGTTGSGTFTTKHIVVFGADDGFVYCLDADPGNAIRYSTVDREGKEHVTYVARCIWRYDTLDLLSSGHTTQYLQVVSSPLVTQFPGGPPTVIVGTGTGYLIWLNANNGRLIRKYAAGPLFRIGSGYSSARQPITSSPALAKLSDGRYVVVFGAADSVVHAVNAQSGEKVWTFITGELATGRTDPNEDPGDRITGVYNPPVVATPCMGSVVDKQAVFIATTGRRDKKATPDGLNAGVVYALDLSNGKELWRFEEYSLPSDAEDAEKHLPGEFRASPAFARVRVYGEGGGTLQDVVIVRSEDANIYCLKAKDGQPAWAAPAPIMGEDRYQREVFSSSPVVSSDGYIFVGGKDGTVRAFYAGSAKKFKKADGSETSPLPFGEEVWRVQTGTLQYASTATGRDDTPEVTLTPGPIYATPALTRGFLYVAATGYFHAFQDVTGAYGIPFVENRFSVGGVPPVRREQPEGGGTQQPSGQTQRIQVDIFSPEDYRNVALTLDDAHSRALGVVGDGKHRWTVTDPGRLEWGDSVYIIAWNLDTNPAVAECQIRLQGPNGTVQITVPVRSGGPGGTGIAKYAFVLDPITQDIVNPLNPKRVIRNPLFDNPLTPGGEGTGVWTVSASQYRTRIVNGAVVRDASAANTSSTEDTKSRFKINNPLEIYLPDGRTALTSTAPDEATRNANQRVPIMPPVEGDHDSTTEARIIRVGDRSHLGNVKQYNNNPDAPEGTLPPAQPGKPVPVRPYLRVKVSPADLQWLGGPEAVYKPLFPYFTGMAPAYPASHVTPVAPYEEPPGPPGVPNPSPDYPNIKAENVEVRDLRSDKDAVRSDVVLPSGPASADLAYRVRIPRYQPANIPPWGPGYATVNPVNDFTKEAALPANRDRIALLTYRPSYPADNTFLARVYVDSNRNGSHDFNEAYRAFIMRAHVRVNESFEIREQAVEIPGPVPGGGTPPPGVPHGFVPYTNYWEPTGGDPALLAAEAPFYRPFTIVNTGNVNLWNVRMAQSPDVVDRWGSVSVDPAFVMAGGKARLKGTIGPENLFSTLDPPFGISSENPFFRVVVRKARVGSAEPQRVVMLNPFGPRELMPPLPCITVAVPPGTPVGKYTTRPVFFEDGVYVYVQGQGGVLLGANGDPKATVQVAGISVAKTRASSTMTVAVEVMEARLTGYPPVQFSAQSAVRPFTVANIDAVPLPEVWNAVPAAYRDPTTGALHLYWSTNRYGDVEPNAPRPWFLAASSMQMSGDSSWGWQYLGAGRWFFEPGPEARWWLPPPNDPYPNPEGLDGFSVFGASAIAQDGEDVWLFFQGDGYVQEQSVGLRQQSVLLYTRLSRGRPVGPLLAMPGDPFLPRRNPKPFFYQGVDGQRMLGVMWDAGDPSRIFVSTTATPENPDSWSPPVPVPMPSGLAYVMHPAPFFKGATSKESRVELVFTGYSRSRMNPDLYLMRLSADSWSVVPLPRVTSERLIRQPGRPVYEAQGMDWLLGSDDMPVIRWTRGDGRFIEFRTPEPTGAGAGRLRYKDESGHYTITVDPAAGTVTFGSDDPIGFPVPRYNDVVELSYRPRVWRLTSDARSDAQPVFFIDRSYETIAPGEPYRVDGSVTLPSLVRRDRMWVIWRKGNTGIGGGSVSVPGGDPGGVGTVGSTTLFFKTYRLMVKLDQPVPIHPQKHTPMITVDGVPPNRWTVDPGTGRVFFTEVDEGKTVTIATPNQAPRQYTINWLPERAGDQTQEFPVPIKMPVNEGQVWAFKDPFSYLTPTGDADTYLSLVNNNVWLFWTSTRNGTSDIYYMTISPKL